MYLSKLASNQITKSQMTQSEPDIVVPFAWLVGWLINLPDRIPGSQHTTTKSTRLCWLPGRSLLKAETK